tara:strand:+ start:682 stop:1065 length:384 start_codon:yes stop_codon:yes gene_type:complete
MSFEIWLVIALTASVMINLFLIWFSVEQSRRLSYVSQNLTDLIDLLGIYRNHLKRVYTLDMFYGDETLQNLMEHTSALVDMLESEYSQVSNITEPLEVIIIEEEDEESEEEKPKQDVFYGGTRTGDS